MWPPPEDGAWTRSWRCHTSGSHKADHAPRRYGARKLEKPTMTKRNKKQIIEDAELEPRRRDGLGSLSGIAEPGAKGVQQRADGRAVGGQWGGRRAHGRAATCRRQASG